MPNYTFQQRQGIVDTPSTAGCQTFFIVRGVKNVVDGISSGNIPAGNRRRLPVVDYRDVFPTEVFGRLADDTFPFGPR